MTFILATTEPHKFPATIISRCQHFLFKRLTQGELEAHLNGLLTRENVPFEPQAVSLIARRGAGSVRDSMHKGEAGTQSLNEVLRERLNPSGPEIVRGMVRFRLGDRVLQTKNDYEKDVFNGDLGHIVEVDPEEGELLVSFDGRSVAYDRTELDELAPAYAISIHKSQGSEYPVVVVPILTQHYVMTRLGDRLKALLHSDNTHFTDGLVAASVIFCTGTMAWLGGEKA